MRTSFVVAPDGRADTSTVVVRGVSDPDYRGAMTYAVSRMRFRAPTVGGCPVWGRGDLQVTAVVKRVRMS